MSVISALRGFSFAAVPWWLYVAGGALIFGSIFYAGWTVRAWKCDSQQLVTAKLAIKKYQENVEKGNKAAIEYETERDISKGESDVRREKIRVIYKDRVVSSDCAPPADVVSVLSDAVSEVNKP